MRVFLDIGAYDGLTLDAIVDYGFDRIHSFEPMPAQFAALFCKHVGRAHVSLHNFGLSNAAGERTMFGTNAQYEASVYQGDQLGRTDETVQTVCAFENASYWLRDNVPDGAEIYAKLNCEGSEADIIEDWMMSGQLWRITHMFVAWDIRRFPGGEMRYRMLRRALEGRGFHVGQRWDIMWAPPYADYPQMLIDGWLSRVCPL